MTVPMTDAAVDSHKKNSPNRPIVSPSKLKNAKATPRTNPAMQTNPNPRAAAVADAAEQVRKLT